MTWLKNININNKLLIGFGVLIVILAGVIFTAYRGIREIQTSQNTLYESQFANATDLLNLRSNLNGIRAEVFAMSTSTERSEWETGRTGIGRRHQEVIQILAALEKRNAGDAELLPNLLEMKTLYHSYAQTRDEVLLPQIFAGEAEPALRLAKGSQQEAYNRIRNIADELGDVANNRAADKVQESSVLAAQVIRGVVVAGVVATLIGLAIAYSLSQVIAVPLRRVSIAAQRIATGDLTMKLEAEERSDELGDLGRSFGTMIANLRNQLKELTEGATSLGAASNEISASTTQMAASASETAAAINETTTTVAEVRQTAEVSNQKAKAVSDSAQRAAQTAQSGRTATTDVVNGMSRIRQQMEAIGSSMGRLSEQTAAIGQIIASVEDLAAQSNLLAVNAAIEAAKAGEHGKGFGVVAAEVKSLAEQSRQATGQVRTILGDIQKATTAAVMATEQGTKAVEAGERQTSAASESIQALAGGVSEAAQSATQIAASSQQQLAGVDQVATAMENIKQASTQNVASSKQLEIAAHNLNELGQRLKQLVASYKI